MATVVDTEPLIRREKNLAMVILPLDGPVEPSWREIFDSTAKAGEYGYDIGLTHDLRAVQGGTAAVASIDLGAVESKGLDAHVKGVLTNLAELVEKVNVEDERRRLAVETIESAAKAWYTKKK